MRWVDVAEPQNRVIGHVLRSQAEHIGDELFLRAGDEKLTYGDANEAANSYAAGLRALGVGRGDTVAVLMDNSLDLAKVTLGANKLGAAWTPTNTTYKGEWLRATFEDGAAKLLVVDAELLPRVAALEEELPFKHIVVNGQLNSDAPSGVTVSTLDEIAGYAPSEPDVVVEPTDLGAVMWTSGTTGRSKGVEQTHGTWMTCSDAIARGRDTADGEVFYCCVPMYNSAGWVLNVYNALVTGTTCAIDRQFSVKDFWNRCRYYGVTSIFTLGAMHMYLLQQAEEPNDVENSVHSAGLVPVPYEQIEIFKTRFGVEYVWQGFGQSEVMPWSITYKGRNYKPGSTGIARDDLEVRALDENDEEVPVGEVGEICIRPRRPGVMFSGYFRRPDATVRAFRNLWYHSGDMGRFDDDGELYFVDRKSDFMRYKGRNISSFELEQLIGRHPDVEEAAAHGVAAAEMEYEDEPKVCVVRREGSDLTAEEVARFVNDNAPYYYVPRYIEFVNDLPHTPTGKVQKFKLKERGVTTEAWDRETAGFVVQR